MALSGIQRTFADILDSIWGKDAQTSIPTQPVSGIAYRDTDAEFESGQKYDSLGESSRWNQMLYLLTGLMSELTAFGILPWSAAQPYSKGALCIGSDGTLWQAQIDIEATSTNPIAPGTDDSVWASPELSGTVPDSRRVIAGTGLTGGGPLSSDVTLAAKLTNSVNLTDSTTAASATAVKYAYDRGTAGVTVAGEAKTTAENALTVANSKQPNLGFTPVQQGGGAGQEGQKIYIGWSPSGLKAQADVLDLGNIVTTNAGTIKAPQAALADRANVATNADKLSVPGWGYTSWNSTPYTASPLYLWCLPTGGSDMMPCSPSVLSVFSTKVTPNVRVGNDGSVIPAGGTWRIMTSRNGIGTIMDLAGGSVVNAAGGVFMAIRVA